MKPPKRIYYLTVFLFLGTTFNIYAQAQKADKIDSPNSFSKKMKGTIGASKITMDITRKDSVLSGTYYYQNIGIELALSGKISSTGDFSMTETNQKRKQTGSFSGNISKQGKMTGTWSDAGNKTQLPVNLLETLTGFATITYQHHHNEKCFTQAIRDSILGGVGGDTCSTVDMDIFQITLANKKTEKSINDFIMSTLGCKNTLHDSCINSILYSLNDMEDVGSQLGLGYELEVNDNNILSFALTQHSYGAGAAHGGGKSKYYNIDLETGKIITLSDLLLPHYEDTLNRIAEKLFTEQNGTEGWDFEPGKFRLNDNFAITPSGIHYLFNQYEIGPYSSGIPEIDISYKDIDKLINPKGYLSRFWDKSN